MEEKLGTLREWLIVLTVAVVLNSFITVMSMFLYGQINKKIDLVEQGMHTPIEEIIRTRDSLCRTLQDSIRIKNTQLQRNEVWIKILEDDVRKYYIKSQRKK